jgi:hypothetical protein
MEEERESNLAERVTEAEERALIEASPSPVGPTPDRPPEMLTEEAMRRMVIDAATGTAAEEASTPYGREIQARIQSEVAAIQARPGAIVDIPPDLPDA